MATTANSLGFSGRSGSISGGTTVNSLGFSGRSGKSSAPRISPVAPSAPGVAKSSGAVSAAKQLQDYNFYAAGSGSGVSVAAPVSDQYDYYNAKLASIYKMNAETAYREALSNTAYQRAVEDLKAAGLNPVLAAGKVSGADTFYGSLDAGEEITSGFSRGSGYSGGRSYSRASSAKSGLSSALKDFNVRNGISAVVSGVTMAATKNFQASAAAYYFSNAILNAVSKR